MTDSASTPARPAIPVQPRLSPNTATLTISEGLHEQLTYFDSIVNRDKILIIFKLIANTITTVRVSDDGHRALFTVRDKTTSPNELVDSVKVSEAEALQKHFRDQERNVLHCDPDESTS